MWNVWWKVIFTNESYPKLQRNHCSFYPFQTEELEAYKDHSPTLTSGHSSEGSRRKPLMNTSSSFSQQQDEGLFEKNEISKNYSMTSDQRSVRNANWNVFLLVPYLEIILREFRSEACFSDSVAMKAWCLHSVKFSWTPGGRIDRIWGLDEWDGSEWWRSWRWLLIFTISTFQSVFLENLSSYMA